MSLSLSGPVHWSQRHPILVMLLALLVLFGGLLAVGRLPIDPPSFAGYPQIQIRIHDPGVPAAIMEARVAQPLEQALADLPGLEDMVSVSSIGLSEVVMSVDMAGDVAGNTDAIQRLVAERLARVREKLPATIDAPQLSLQTGGDMPVAELLIGSSTLSLEVLQKWVGDSLVPEFSDIPGFAHYEIIGGPGREIRVIPDQRRLAALGLALEDVVSVLRRYKDQVASHGQIGVTPASTQTVDSLSLRLADGDTVALSEVARVQEEEAQDAVQVYRDGSPVLRLLLYRQPGTSALGMGEAFKARLAWLRTNALIPQAVRVEWMANPLIGLKRMGRSYLTLSTGVLLLTLVVIGGLYRRPRAVLLSAVAAIISLMLVFAFYKLAGLVINALSLGGMVVGYAFALGLPLMALDMLRHPSPGIDATTTRQRVQHRLLTVLTVSVLALAPVLAFGGLFGLVFHAVVGGLLATLVTSALVSLILVPAYAGHPAGARKTSGVGGYIRVLASLQRAPRLLAVGTLLVLMFIPVGLYDTLDNFRFLPPRDTDEVRLRIALPAGLSREQIEPLRRALEDRVRRNGEVNAILTQIGSSDPQPTQDAGSQDVLLRIELQMEAPHRRRAAVWRRDFERSLAVSPPLGSVVPVSVSGPSSLRAPRFEDPITLAASGEISLRVYGPDRAVLTGIAARVIDHLRAQPGLSSVRLAGGGEKKEMVSQLDPERAEQRNLDDVATARVLRIAQGGLSIGHVADPGGDIGLRVFLSPPARPDKLPRLLLRGEKDNLGAVYLDDVATGLLTTLPLERWREQLLPMLEIRAALTADAAPGVVVRDLRTLMEQSVLPSGYRVALRGFADSMPRYFLHMLTLLGVSLALLLLLGLRLRTLRGTMFILVILLFAFAGAVTGIVWAGLPLSLSMGLGAILLIVVGAFPPLLVVDTLRRDRAASSDTSEASAAHRYWRPMLVFGISGLLSLVPLACGVVPGFELLQPLALVLSAGLGFSLLGSLFLIPVWYPGTGR